MSNKIRYALSGAIIAGAVGTVGYQSNWFSSRNAVTKYATAHTTVVSNKHLSSQKREAIASLIMKQTHASEGLTKQGFVSVPTVGILQPIFDNAYSNKGLNAGANYANRSAVDPTGQNKPVMGDGNYGLASHNFNDGKTGFSALQENLNNDAPYLVNGELKGSNWLNGQSVYLANDDNVFEYRITGQDLVRKDTTEVLNPTSYAKTTIISCLFPSTEYRIITNATLKNKWSWETVPDKVATYFDLAVQKTNAHANWFNPGEEEGNN